uniref:dTDP-4-dehydrorhamnose reductase n=1 Tax=Candidatus Scatousia sp. TaxID=3085663 RepID=UPI0040273EBF
MKILVTGAKGMLGQDLCPILEDVGAFVIETDVDTLDITKGDAVEQALTDIHPDMVIHCAAYTNVDKAEEELETAKLINVTGTENIAKICGKLDIPLVYISTDYVFDGTKTEPYAPDDTTNPLNNYGLTKLQGEEAVKKYCEKYYIARTSWLYGHYGKNFVETMISLADKDELKVVDDQIGCPTWTVELANGILKLLSKPYGTYHVCGSGTTSWYGFAQEIFKQTGLNVNLKPCTTEEFPRPAKRPQYSVMANENICRNWQVALHDYLELRDV